MSELKKSYFAVSMTAVCIDVLLITCCTLLAIVDPTTGESTCRYSKQRGYFTVDCADRKLDEIPENLKSDVEVLDLSSNRIRSLHNNSFACCSSMKLLYLQHNSIFEIESHAFYPLSGLEVLDLSVNVISEMPYLPNTLRKLYLDDNPRLFYSNLTHPKLKIDSLTSLETLTISSNKLSGFPVFDVPVPNLLELNITKNPIDIITVEHLAPLCQLKFLYLSTEKMFSRPEQNCDCLKFDWWIRKYEITVKTAVTCRKDKNVKCVVEPKNTTLAMREKCLEELNSRKLPYKLMFGGGVVAVILGFCVVLYVHYRRKTRQQRRTAATGQNSRTPNVQFGKALEDKCTNHAFDYKGSRTRPPGGASWETPV